jgi:AcrR family transcriptional regulator
MSSLGPPIRHDGRVSVASAQPERIWAGTTLAARRAARRERLLAAGLDLLGTQGAAAVTVRSVCRHAQLTDRYFYENFADRAELLLAVFDEVAAQAAAALVSAAAAAGDEEQAARAAVEAFIDLLTDDPRMGRVLLVEPLTDIVLGTRGIALAPMFAQIIRAQLGQLGAADGADSRAALVATAMVGALANLFIRWLDGSETASRDELVEFCVQLLVTTAPLARG